MNQSLVNQNLINERISSLMADYSPPPGGFQINASIDAVVVALTPEQRKGVHVLVVEDKYVPVPSSHDWN